MPEHPTLQEIDQALKKAEADGAAVDAARKKAEFEEWLEGAAQRRADAAADSLALRLKNDESQRTAVKALVPDLTGVDRGSLTVPDSATMFQALLGGRALDDAASKIIPKIKGEAGLDQNFRVLVTTNLDLLKADLSYHSLVRQLERLTKLVGEFKTPTVTTDLVPALVIGVAQAAAALLPGLLSLTSAKRTVTATNSTVDDTAALMAVAGKLAEADAQATVVVDTARVLEWDGSTVQAWTAFEGAVEELDVLVQGLRNDADKPARLAEGEQLLKTCRAALSAMTTVADGATASPLATAVAQEVLHSEEFHGVLIVKGGAASSTQLVDDRPLRFGDPFSVVSTATISYLLVEHRDRSRVKRGGMLHGSAQMHGKIGDTLSLPN